MSWAQAIGGAIGAIGSYMGAKENIRYQKKFAQNAISWKVADAKRAGIHPLAALGASTHSFQPVSFGDLSETGQNIGRAIDATADKSQRYAADVGGQMAKLQLENQSLQNIKLASEINLQRQAGSPPPFPLDKASPATLMMEGQGDSKLVQKKPNEITHASPVNPGAEAGAHPDISWSNNGDGSFSLLPSKNVKERIEDMSMPQWQWSARNFLTPSGGHFPYPAPAGQQWVYNPLTGRAWLEQARGVGRFSNPGPYRR